MTKILITIIAVFYTTLMFSQETGNDSYTIQRLIIYNQKGEILLEKNHNGWMTPALRHNNKLSINEALFDLANKYGLKISTPKLSGIFMFINKDDYKSSFRTHYSCKYIEGNIKIPEKKSDAKWFSINKAIEMMSLPETKAIFAMRDMTKQIILYPKIIWGGTFVLDEKNNKVIYKILEGFYPLTD